MALQMEEEEKRRNSNNIYIYIYRQNKNIHKPIAVFNTKGTTKTFYESYLLCKEAKIGNVVSLYVL